MKRMLSCRQASAGSADCVLHLSGPVVLVPRKVDSMLWGSVDTAHCPMQHALSTHSLGPCTTTRLPLSHVCDVGCLVLVQRSVMLCCFVLQQKHSTMS